MSQLVQNKPSEIRSASTLWRRILDDGSDEYCSIRRQGEETEIEGALVGSERDGEPFFCNYRILADAAMNGSRYLFVNWRSAIGPRSLTMVRKGPCWTIETAGPAFIQADEIDLEWSPVTNLFPIRRLIADGSSSLTISAAWVRASDLRIEPAIQRYDQVDELTVRYTNLDSGFSALIHHDGNGLPIDYEGVWEGRSFRSRTS